MDTPKTIVAVQELLLRSWKERLPDIQWSIQMKKVLKGATIDGYTLCDMILSQMFIGPNPSSLLITYLKHCICTQMVSHVAVLRSLTKYEDTCVSRPFCMKSLLDILKLCVYKISCHGPPEECLQIAVALLQVILWMVKSISLSLESLAESGNSHVKSNLETLCDHLFGICSNDQTRMLLFVARLEDEALWSQLEGEFTTVTTFIANTCTSGLQRGQMSQLEHILSSTRPQMGQVMRKDNKEKVLMETLRFRLERALESALRVPNCTYHSKYLHETHSMEYGCSNINGYINIITFLETNLNLTQDPRIFVDQILLYEKLKNLSRREVYTSLIQGALLGIADNTDDADHISSFAFFFLKLPQILSHLHHNPTLREQKGPILFQSLKHVLQYVSLLNLVDETHQCDCLQQFVEQLERLKLLNKNQIEELVSKRQSIRNTPLEAPQQQHLVINAESTLPTIFNSLDITDSSMLEEMLGNSGVFHHLLAGRSCQLVAATSAATNRLKKFSSKLACINEVTKIGTVDGSLAHAVLFDISFLMLCQITQQYGVEMVLNNEDELFFERWAQQCLPDVLGSKPLYGTSFQSDQAKVDQLIQLFLASGDLKTMQLGSEDLCHYIPLVIEQTLTAWQLNFISKDQVQTIADAMHSEIFCLGVCAATWLSSCAVGVDNNPCEGSKVWLFFEMFLEQKASPKVGYYKDAERAGMMMSIIEKMKLHMSCTSVKFEEQTVYPTTVGAAISTESSSKVLSQVFREMMDKKLLTKKIQSQLELTFAMSGITWICWNVVSEILQLSRRDEVGLAVEAAFGLFQVDNEQLTISLLRRVLPRLLSDPSYLSGITDPRGRLLAKLAVWCIASTLTTQNSYRGDPKTSKSQFRPRKRKRTRAEIDRDGTSSMREDIRPSKLRRLLSIPDDDNTASAMSATLTTSSGQFLVPQTSMQLSEPIYKAIASLMQLFTSILSENSVNSRTEFIFSFLQEILLCGEAVSSTILQFMPVAMANYLFSTIRGSFMQDLALAIGQLDSVVARKQAARALCIIGR